MADASTRWFVASPALLAKELARTFRAFGRLKQHFQNNLQETEEYFAELQDCGHYDEDQRSCISFPAHELAYLHSVGDCAPCLLIAGTSDGAKLRALECVLGERVLPDLPSDADNAGGGTADGVGNGNGGGGGDGGGSSAGAACRATRLRHGTERRASLVLPGQFELLHPQQATPPQQQQPQQQQQSQQPQQQLQRQQLQQQLQRQLQQQLQQQHEDDDWERTPAAVAATAAYLRMLQPECQDPAFRQAQLELSLPHPLLKEVSVVLAPSRQLQPLTAALEELRSHFLPVVLYAVASDRLCDADALELAHLKQNFSEPVFFLRLPPPHAPPHAPPAPPYARLTTTYAKLERDLLSAGNNCGGTALHQQLVGLDYLGGAAAAAASGTSAGRAHSALTDCADRLPHFSRLALHARLVEATGVLGGVHARGLDLFISHAFDMARDLQITPRRLQYTRAKEEELYASLLEIANEKQEEIRQMIVDTLDSMRKQLLEEAATTEFADVPVSNGESGSGRGVQRCSKHIQELVLNRLKEAVASKLIASVDYLRESFVGTLARCLDSLEKSGGDVTSNSLTSSHLKQILNAAYHVEVTFQSGSSVAYILWEQIKQLIHSLTWTTPPAPTAEWKRKVAQDTMESLSASKLAKNICSQFRARLNHSHEAFASSLRQLEAKHSGRLERTEDMWLRVRKDHAPRLARLSLESRSLRDILLHGMPRLGPELGRGQYGVVYACHEPWGGHAHCALKSVIPPDDKHWNDLALEFHYTRSMPRHDRLVSLHGSVIDYTYGGGSNMAVLLIMDRLLRDLYTAIKGGLVLAARLRVALDVVEGIRFLHSQGLVHRDIKLKNVLLDKSNRAKITDLGFCKPEAMMSGSIVGTPIHMAPELFSGEFEGKLTSKYDNSVDVYAFGILFWYVCAGAVRLPEAFERCATKDQLWTNVRRGTRPERLPLFDEECWQLMEACWDGDPARRPLLGIVQPRLLSIMHRLCGS